MTYAYSLKSTGHSSERYGNCEVCDKHCSEVFIQAETRGYDNPETGQMSYTYYGAHPHLFGHRDCLVGRQKVQQ